MDDASQNPVHVTLPARAWAAAAVVVVLLFATFAFMTHVLLDQRRLIDSQNRKAYAQLERITPVLEAAQPVLGEARRQAPAARRTARATRRLAETGVPLLDALRAADLPNTTRLTGQALATLFHGDRLAGTLDATRAVLGQARTTDLVPRAAATLQDVGALASDLRSRHATGRLLRAADETVRLRRRADRLLGLQQRALDVLTETLAIQKQALRHIESLDRKTGGQLAAPGAATGHLKTPGSG
jgi:hypothetical protein